jgi:hypothetical protein
LRLFLDSKGFSELNERRMKKWQPEDYREFELMQERLAYLLEIFFFPDMLRYCIISSNLEVIL